MQSVAAIIAIGFPSSQMIVLIELVTGLLQALALPITLYLLVVQTRAMRLQTNALLEQSKEMTAQTRIFTDTIYSSTLQGLYDAEAHLGELMMTYPQASRLLMSPLPQPLQEQQEGGMTNDQTLDPELRERVRWLGTAMLDFFEHIWTQAQKGALSKDVWEAWEEYMLKMLGETRLRQMWPTERVYYDPGFRRFVDQKVGLKPDTPVIPPLPRMATDPITPVEHRPGDAKVTQVAHVLRAVTQEVQKHMY